MVGGVVVVLAPSRALGVMTLAVRFFGRGASVVLLLALSGYACGAQSRGVCSMCCDVLLREVVIRLLLARRHQNEKKHEEVRNGSSPPSTPVAVKVTAARPPARPRPGTWGTPPFRGPSTAGTGWCAGHPTPRARPPGAPRPRRTDRAATRCRGRRCRWPCRARRARPHGSRGGRPPAGKRRAALPRPTSARPRARRRRSRRRWWRCRRRTTRSTNPGRPRRLVAARTTLTRTVAGAANVPGWLVAVALLLLLLS